MDASYFRDKAATCLRLAKGLSWNNPARDELIELAEEFQRQAAELEASAGPAAEAVFLRRLRSDGFMKIFLYFQYIKVEPASPLMRYFL
jgi:hypothetical protein